MNYEEALQHYSEYDEQDLIIVALAVLQLNHIEPTEENIELTIIQGAEKELYGEFELN